MWELLSPVARRVAIETLKEKRVAVDASIWLVQFLKAMRDDEGNPVPNAHLLGTFQRLCKLLYHQIRPVFVFDGGAPALKCKILLRRSQRRNNQARWRSSYGTAKGATPAHRAAAGCRRRPLAFRHPPASSTHAQAAKLRRTAQKLLLNRLARATVLAPYITHHNATDTQTRAERERDRETERDRERQRE